MADDILVSVCMPTYNQGEFIEEALCSLIDQTYGNLEIIVGDNASTDDTEKIVRKLMEKDDRIIYIKHEKDIGVIENFNFLVKKSSGRYIKHAFSDDVYMPTLIEEELNFLERNKDSAGVFTFKQDIDQHGNLLPSKGCLLERERKEAEIIVDSDLYFKYRLKYNENIIIVTSSLTRKTVLDDMAGVDPAWEQVSDFELCVRMLEKYRLGIINKRLVHYRKHHKQDSRYFVRFNRDELLISLSYLMCCLNQERYRDLRKKYGGYLDKLVAEDYLMLLQNRIFQGEKKDVKKFIDLSEQYFRFPVFSKGWVLQRADRFVVYFLVRTYLRIKRTFCVCLLKRRYVFDV